ncbi:MAG: hypothetical protein RIF46_15430 [Cyclobacteriaceae bacterium]
MRIPLIIFSILLLVSCKNRDLNEGEEFRPRVIEDNFKDSHFTRVKVDGVEYLMLERDNNNPHEGFGFMAFRANIMLEKQDTLLAYVKAIGDFQVKILAATTSSSEDKVQDEFDELFNKYLNQEQKELDRLEQDSLLSR